jgi:hypothetical protein
MHSPFMVPSGSLALMLLIRSAYDREYVALGWEDIVYGLVFLDIFLLCKMSWLDCCCSC